MPSPTMQSKMSNMTSDCGSAMPPKHYSEPSCNSGGQWVVPSEMNERMTSYERMSSYDKYSAFYSIMVAIILLTVFIWLIFWSWKPSFFVNEAGELNTRMILGWSLGIAILLVIIFALIKNFSSR